MKYLLNPVMKNIMTAAELELIEESLNGLETAQACSIRRILQSNDVVTKDEKELMYEYVHSHQTMLFEGWFEIANQTRQPNYTETEKEHAERTKIWREMGKWRALCEKIQAIIV